MTAPDRIRAQALAGTPYNPGLPAALASLVVGQSGHETGGWTSDFFVDDNNAFGYARYDGSLYQIGGGGTADNGAPIGKYASIEDSTKEMVDYLWRRYHKGQFPALDTIKTPEQYADLLKKVGYYQAPESVYLAGIRRFFLPVAAVGIGSGLLVAGVLLVVFRKEFF
jgi:hypothetical protein